MATQVQHRRNTEANNNTVAGAAGEIFYATDTKELSVHDGSSTGGFRIPQEVSLIGNRFGYASSTGTNTITLTVEGNLDNYAAGQQFKFLAANTITGAATINVNTLGAKNIKKPGSSGKVDLVAGDIVAGIIYNIIYDGTDFIILGGVGGGDVLLSEQDASNDASIDFDSVFSS